MTFTPPVPVAAAVARADCLIHKASPLEVCATRWPRACRGDVNRRRRVAVITCKIEGVAWRATRSSTGRWLYTAMPAAVTVFADGSAIG